MEPQRKAKGDVHIIPSLNKFLQQRGHRDSGQLVAGKPPSNRRVLFNQASPINFVHVCYLGQANSLPVRDLIGETTPG